MGIKIKICLNCMMVSEENEQKCPNCDGSLFSESSDGELRESDECEDCDDCGCCDGGE